MSPHEQVVFAGFLLIACFAALNIFLVLSDTHVVPMASQAAYPQTSVRKSPTYGSPVQVSGVPVGSRPRTISVQTQVGVDVPNGSFEGVARMTRQGETGGAIFTVPFTLTVQ